MSASTDAMDSEILIEFSAARKLIAFPAVHTPSITEVVRAGWDEIARDITMTVDLPSSEDPASLWRDAEADLDDDVTTGALFAVPILFPRKGQVADLSDVEDGDGNRLTLLAHDEHSDVTKLLLRESLWLAARPLLAARGLDAIQTVVNLQSKMDELVECYPDEADQRLLDLRTSAEYLVLPASAELNQFDALCRRFSERYAVFVILDANFESTITIKFTTCNAVFARGKSERLGDLARRLFGDRRTEMRIPLQRARRTRDYHLYVESPPSHYCFEQVVMRSQYTNPSESRREAILPTMETTGHEGTARYASSRGARSTAHLYVVNGNTSTAWLDANVLWQEIPLGSAGSALMASALSALVAFSLFVLSFTSARTQVTPTVVILLLTSALVPATAMFLSGRAEPSLLSRAASFALAFLGVLYAGWWTLLVTPDSNANALHILGVMFALAYAGIVAVTAWRAYRAVTNHVSTVEEGA